MFKIFLIGAGQIGSRHLQALKKVKTPLEITVIDPSNASLQTSQQRYEEVLTEKNLHQISYLKEIPENQKIDLAIIATSSDVRAVVTKKLLQTNRVRFLILEKLLFNKKRDYVQTEKLLAKQKIKTWVNCPLRLRSIYQKMREDFHQMDHLSFRLTGHNFGLATNAIHCLDYMAYLLKSTNFKIDTSHLDSKIIPSKRKGFLELTGSLCASFGQKGRGEFSSYASGNAPRLVEVSSPQARYIFTDQEKDDQALVTRAKNSWELEKIPFHTPLVSETTTWIVEDLIKNKTCQLTPYQESAKIHLNFLEPLRQFLNQNSKKKYDYYPFT